MQAHLISTIPFVIYMQFLDFEMQTYYGLVVWQVMFMFRPIWF